MHAWLQETQAPVVLVDHRSGALIHMSAPARELIGQYYPGSHDRVAPQWVTDWLRAVDDGEAPNALSIAAAHGVLRVRALAARSSESLRVLLIDEQRSAPTPGARSLDAFGLTGRQTEVLRLLALGHTTRRIAEQLYLSPATVRKHLEHIYRRLGVTSRTEAVAIARST